MHILKISNVQDLFFYRRYYFKSEKEILKDYYQNCNLKYGSEINKTIENFKDKHLIIFILESRYYHGMTIQEMQMNYKYKISISWITRTLNEFCKQLKEEINE